jgi:hypothetical protein
MEACNKHHIAKLRRFPPLSHPQTSSRAVHHQLTEHSPPFSYDIDFADEVLKKSHGLQVQLSRSGTRMEVLRGVMRKKNRDPLLALNPGNETRWNSGIDEAERANTIMGDACEAFEELLSESGEDYSLLDKGEKDSGNIDHHTYTQE